MKYAREVIDLMAAYPGREFRMAEIVRYCCRSDTEHIAARRGIRRVLERLIESGNIRKVAPKYNGGGAIYIWK